MSLPIDQSIWPDKVEESRRALLSYFSSATTQHVGYIIALVVGFLAIISRWDTFLVNSPPAITVLFYILISGILGIGFNISGRTIFWASCAHAILYAEPNPPDCYPDILNLYFPDCYPDILDDCPPKRYPPIFSLYLHATDIVRGRTKPSCIPDFKTTWLWRLGAKFPKTRFDYGLILGIVVLAVLLVFDPYLVGGLW